VSKVCDHETSTKRGGPGPYRGCRAIEEEEEEEEEEEDEEENEYDS
jgi:hypothetical protein